MSENRPIIALAQLPVRAAVADVKPHPNQTAQWWLMLYRYLVNLYVFLLKQREEDINSLID